MHLRPRKKLAAQLKTVWRPVTMLVFYHTLVTKHLNYRKEMLRKLLFVGVRLMNEEKTIA